MESNACNGGSGIDVELSKIWRRSLAALLCIEHCVSTYFLNLNLPHD